MLASDDKSYLAMDYLAKAMALDSSFTDAAVFLGNLAYDAKWWDRAENAYLFALRGGNSEGLQGLRNGAYDYYSQGRREVAVELLERVVGLVPGDGELRRELEGYREEG